MRQEARARGRWPRRLPFVMTSTPHDALTSGASGAATRTRLGLTDLALFAMAVIWGANVSVVKYATQWIAPLAFNGPRVMLAAVCLVAVTFAARERWPSRRDAIALMLLGVIGNGVYQIFFIEGIARTRAASAALMLAATPAFIAAIGWMRGVEHTSRRGVLGIVASFLGIALVIAGGGRTGGRDTLLGNMLVLGGCLSWSVFTVWSKPYTHRVRPLPLAALTMAGGAVPLLLVASPQVVAADWGAMPPGIWLALLYSGIGALVIAYLFWHRGVRVLGPTRAAMYGNLQPAIAVLAAWLMLGETPTALEGVGAASIVTGLLLSR